MALYYKISQSPIFKAQIERHHKTKVKKKSKNYFLFKNLLGDYSRPQQAALGLFWATIVAHSSVRVNSVITQKTAKMTFLKVPFRIFWLYCPLRSIARIGLN